jgi:hypothetical protein
MSQRHLCALVVCITGLLGNPVHAFSTHENAEPLPSRTPELTVAVNPNGTTATAERIDAARGTAESTELIKTDMAMDLSNQIVLIPVPPALIIGAVGLAGVIWKRRSIIQSLR